MATNAQKSTTSRTVKGNAAAPPRPEPELRPVEKRAEPAAKTGQAPRAKAPTPRAAQKPKGQPYQMEIVALADTTADLPPPWRKQAIRAMRPLVALFERAWRELRRRPAPVAGDAVAPRNPVAAADPTLPS
ncbi:MAG: hypothetical protein NT169_22950 [Chloroflexi bacterium]|nr:hypothetical protein [Chloroflexota bacterium]